MFATQRKTLAADNRERAGTCIQHARLPWANPPAVQAFVATGIALVLMHGLVLATLPPGAAARPLAERPAGSRTVEALAPAAARTPVVDELLDRLAEAAREYALKR